MPIDQYASARPYFPATPPAGYTTDDQARLQTYDVYENFYWNNPDAFKIVPRSEDARPIYLPAARSIIEASNRFLAVKWDFLVDPRVGLTGDRDIVTKLLRNTWKRETMYAKFANTKRMGLIRGDAMWHITADPAKLAGTRISIHELHPGNYFPIWDEDNPDRVIGCYIVDTTPDPRDSTNTLSRRQMYRKDPDSGLITSELALFEINKWDDRADADNATKVQDVVSAYELPPSITQIPVYHIKNMRTGTMWGSSELRGIETVMAAVNQAVSDQDLALSMQGLGVYWTDAGPPRDADGNATDFVMGPGEVVEIPTGTNFGRVSGISGSLPGIEHMKYIIDSATEAVAVPQIARGMAEVSVAESGIALMLQMSPLLAKNAEKEQEMLGVYDQMLYDIVQMWLPAYEGVSEGIEVEVACVVGDPMPKNRESEIAEILSLATTVPPLITIEMAQAKLSELGYEFPAGAAAAVQAQAAAQAAAADPFAARASEELVVEEEV